MGATEDRLKYDAERQRERMGDTLDAIGDRLSPERVVERRKAAVTQRFRSVKESVMGTPGYVEQRSSGMMQSAGDTVQSAAQQVQHAPQAIADQARGNPVAAGIVAFGVGMLLATVLPKSEAEQRLVDEARPQIQQATEHLKDAGRDVAEGAKEHAREAMDEVKATGSEAAANVKQQASSSAEEVRNRAQQ